MAKQELNQISQADILTARPSLLVSDYKRGQAVKNWVWYLYPSYSSIKAITNCYSEKPSMMGMDILEMHVRLKQKWRKKQGNPF